MPLSWSIFLFWPTGREKTKCCIWAVGLMTGSMVFCISGGKQYWQQRAAFWAGLCICRQHCAVNEINVGKIIRCLLLPQFAVRHRGWMGQPSEKAKTPEQHKAIRALGLAIWADKKRLFSQAWVEVAAAGVRLFLTSQVGE